MSNDPYHNGLPQDYVVSRDHVISFFWRIGQNSEIPSELKFFAFAIGAYMLRYPNNCKPSMEQLSGFMGLSLRQTKYISAKAKKCQPLLEELQIIPGKGRSPSKYRPNFSYEDEIAAYAERQKEKKDRHLQLVSDNSSGASYCTTSKGLTVQQVAPLRDVAHGATHCTTNSVVVQSDTLVVQPAAPNDINDSINDKNTTSQTEVCDGEKKTKKKNQKNAVRKYTKRFEIFWKVYVTQCKKSGSSPGTKSEAFDEWKKFTSEAHDAAEKGLRAYVTASNNAQQSLKHCCRYLKHRAWESCEDTEAPDKWFNHPKANSMTLGYYRKILDEVRPNGHWPESSLGPPPGNPDCVFPKEYHAELGLEKYRVGGGNHDQ